MKKLILGIVGIVVLDLAFILALIDGDDSTELAAAPPPPPVSHQTQSPEFSQLPILDSDPREEDDIAPTQTIVRNPTLSNDYATKTSVRTKRAFNNRTNETSAPNFKDTIIWYQGPNRENNRQNVSTASVLAKAPSNQSVRKKRNVLSRAFSITKKPYDWVKSLAAKL